MAPYIILSLVIGPVRACTFQLPGEHTALQPCGAIDLSYPIAISVPTGIHLHLSGVKHLRVKCLVQGHNIDITMYQC